LLSSVVSRTKFPIGVGRKKDAFLFIFLSKKTFLLFYNKKIENPLRPQVNI
jgi:hypothetical protein